MYAVIISARNIVPVHCFSVLVRFCLKYLYTVHVSGGTMLDRISQMGSFSEKKASEYIGAILAAINYMHSLDIVHRDLKCDNLMFDRKGSSGRLQIIDFGESLMVQSGRKYADFVGTIHYVSTPSL